MRQLCAPLEHADTKVVCLAERALLRSLEGGCKVPIAVRSHVGSKRAADGEADGAAAHKQARTLELWAGVTSVDGAEFAEAVHAAELQPQRSDDAKGDKEDDEVVALMLGARAAAADAVEERAVRLGCELARKLRGAGAEAILRRIRDSAADAEDG
jgi:hydroxymethylbilane synthase